VISAEKIGDLIRNPHLAGSVPANELQEIREKFPYSSTLHLLYLKNIALSNDVQFEDQLRYAAAHVMDRERMYHVVHSGEPSTIVTAENPASDPGVIAGKEVAPEIQKQSFEPTGKISENDQEAAVGEPESISILTARTENEVSVPDQPGEAIHDDADQLEEAILPSLADRVYEKALADMEASHSEQQAGEEPEPLESTQSVGKPEENVDLSKLSFVEWLRYKQTQQADKNTAGAPLHKQGQQPVVKEGSPVIGSTDKKKKLSKNDVDSLLNKFISEEPSISRPKTAFFNPTVNARQSLEETADLVTETLAKIYVLQKNYSKAIKAYEQLSLVYPEKKTFFAGQIKKIREEQINNK
jgi:hypothetical protein